MPKSLRMKLKSKVVEVEKCNINKIDLVRIEKINKELNSAIQRKNGYDIKYLLECFRYYQCNNNSNSDSNHTIGVLLLSKKRIIKERSSQFNEESQHDGRRRRRCSSSQKKASNKTDHNRRRG